MERSSEDKCSVVLDCLSIDFKAAVSTSVLSKRWKYCWTRVRKSVFKVRVIQSNVELQNFVKIVDSVLSRT